MINVTNSAKNMSNLELQALLLISELELFVRAGGQLNTDIVICMDNFRKVELLETGSNNTQIKDMVQMLKAEIGHLNKN